MTDHEEFLHLLKGEKDRWDSVTSCRDHILDLAFLVAQLNELLQQFDVSIDNTCENGAHLDVTGLLVVDLWLILALVQQIVD